MTQAIPNYSVEIPDYSVQILVVRIIWLLFASGLILGGIALCVASVRQRLRGLVDAVSDKLSDLLCGFILGVLSILPGVIAMAVGGLIVGYFFGKLGITIFVAASMALLMFGGSGREKTEYEKYCDENPVDPY